MNDALSLGTTFDRPRPAGAPRRLWLTVGRGLARLNGTAVAGSLHASDMAQLRRAMRD